MISEALKNLLEDTYGLSEVRELDDTEEFTLLSAFSTVDGNTQRITVYKAIVDDFRKQELLDVHERLDWVKSSAVDLQDFAVTDDRELVLISSTVTGTSLPDFVERRTQWESPLTAEEVANLLRGVASSIDSINSAGCADFLAGKLDAAYLYVADNNSQTPVLLTAVGPQPYPTNTSPQENVEAFRQICTSLVEGASLSENSEYGSAEDVLKALSPQNSAAKSWADSAEPEVESEPWISTDGFGDSPEYGKEVADTSPKQVFPDREDTMWDLAGQDSEHGGEGSLSPADATWAAKESTPAAVTQWTGENSAPAADSSWGEKESAVSGRGFVENEQSAEMNRQVSASSTQAPYATKSRHKVGPWIALLVVLVLLGGLGVAGYIFREPLLGTYREVVLGESEWSEDDQQIVQAFPGIIGDRDGAEGWNGLTCESRPPAKGREATISCADARLNVTIHQFANRSERDKGLPGGATVVIGNDTCQVTSKEITDQEFPAYVLAPSGEKDTFMIVINGPDSEQKRLELPICDVRSKDVLAQ